ncbi:MAG: prepilin-type N-terminal cleavage/methylation domain-containing protein [Pseudohongiella sp.]|nr:prepilin-type N-terminal cleavage/methylation domain-containing protein [Pseudohongiella sp.]
MKIMGQAHRQAGFTLVEIMLALALTAMLLSLLSSSVYIIAEDWNRSSDILDESLDEALAVLQIDRALQGAFPHSYTNEESLAREIYFLGEDDYLSWVSTVSPQRNPGLTAWELYSVDDEGVYLSLAPAFSDNPDERLSNAEPVLILANYTMELSYLYEDLNESKRWTDEWTGSERLALPLAVYVHFIPLDEVEEDKQALEIVAPIKNNQHRSIRALEAGPGLRL